MRRLSPTTLALIIGGLLLLGVVAFLLSRGSGENQDKLSDDQLASASNADPAKRCGSQRTYDVIKRELFRQAAEMRGSDQATFDRLAAFASLRVESPRLKSDDDSIGLVRCSGRLSLDLPPGVAVVGGRTTLSATMDYVLQSAADGTGDVVILEGADAIVVPLATLARTGANQPLPNVPAEPAPADDGQLPADSMQPEPRAPGYVPPSPAPQQPSRPAPAPAVREPAPAPPPRATASPSFNCRYARTSGEIAVCRDAGLASLDRQMASQYYRAVAQADARQRELLRRTRSAFLRYRDNCPNEACIADTYRGRIREIRDIMSGNWQPPR